MATPKDILKKALAPKEEDSPKHEADESPIVELVERVFTSRNLVDFQQWATKSGAQHRALGALYDAIVDETDDIVENFIGEFDIHPVFETECAKLDGDIVARIKDDADWVKANRAAIANGSDSLGSLVDILTASYNKTLYKLRNLS